MTTTQNQGAATMNSNISRISRGFHAGRINGATVLVTGSKGEWVVSVNGEVLEGHFPTLFDAEVAAELSAR